MKTNQRSQIARAAALPLVVAIALVSGISRADHVVSYDSPLVPPDLRPGDSFHLVFVTSATYNRLSEPITHPANINYFNGLVNSAADSSSLPNVADPNWFAIVSTRSTDAVPVVVNARDNAVVSAPVYRLDDTRVAGGVSDMWDGALNAAISINQNGTSVSASVWTGCAPYTGSGLADGTYALGGGAQGLIGTTTSNLGTWLANGGHTRQNTDASLRLFALSERITIAAPPDADSDGLPDWYEQANTTPSSATSLVPGDDPDQDGISSLGEYQIDTRLVPTDPDTDGDGLLDGASIALTSSDPRYTAWVAAGITYSDNVGTRTFRGETTVGTNPLIVDTDGDGLADGVESNTGIWVSATNTGTNPLDKDTDNDSLSDQVETNTGTLVSKTNTGTNPLLADTDADGAGDWYEITATFTSPFLPAEKPNIPYPLPDPDATPPATNKPVKVFILSGQSNMVGIGYGSGTGFKPGSLESITKTENKFPNLIDGAGNFTSRQDVWYEGVITATAKKWLSIGCGNSSDNIGPELGFGHVMGWYLNEPVLIIKASQGNRGLGWDILPPTSPSYNYTDGKTYAGYGQSPNSWTTAGGAPSPFAWYAGKQYDDFFLHERDMGPLPWAAGLAYPASCYVKHNGWTYVSASAHTSEAATAPQVNGSGNPIASPTWNVHSVDNVADVLDNFSTRFASQGWAAQGFEIAGFAWFQGHWDQSEPYASKYEDNLVRFIAQTRSYYASRYPGKIAPQTPFAVATIGFGGQPYTPGTPSYKVHAAQLAVGNPAIHPEFSGTVKSVDSLPFWRELAESPGTQGYHYNNNAETYTLVGDALGRLMVDMLQANSGPDTTPPSILALNPADNATTAPVGTNLVATFNEVIAMGTGDITIENLTDTTQVTIAVTDNSQVSISGNVLTINPAALLIPGKDYAIRIAATAIEDSAGNDFAGIADDTTWNFSTPAPDLTPPSVSSFNPAVGAVDIALAANLVATFSEAIAIGTGDVTIKNLTNATETTIAVTDAAQVSVSGGVLTINPAADLLPGKQYAIRIAAGAIVDLSNNPFAGIADDTTWSFTTIPPDLSPPAVVTFSPADNAASASPGGNLVLTFNEAITLGTGDVILKNLTDSTETVIPVTDAAQVSLAGSVLTINPATDPGAGKSYAVRIESGAVEDLAGNPFAGIGDDTTWNFTVSTVPFVWTQTAGGAQAWDTGANWLGGAAPSPVAGDTVDFSTANITANTTLTLGADRTAEVWKFGDATTASHDWTVSAGNKMILAGTTPTIHVVNRTATLSNVVDGGQGLTKTGAGTLVLSGSNTTFSGGTTLNAGTITAANNNALGTSGTVTFTGNATLGAGYLAAGYTLPVGVVVNNGVTATFNPGNQYQRLTITGPLSGTGNLLFSTGAGGAAGELNFTNSGNTFTGKVQVSMTGNGGGGVTVHSLADSANPIQLTGNANSANFKLGGTGANASSLLFNSRQIELNGTGAGGGSIENNNSDTSRTITIGTNLLVSATGNKTLTLGGSNTGANAFNGIIANGSVSAATQVISLTKSGGGTWTLSNANTYTGKTTIPAGTLSINSIGDVSGGSSALGNPNSAANGLIVMGSGNSTATLLYTGAGHSSDRTLQINSSDNTNTGGSTITNNGSGALTFTAPTLNNTYTLASVITRTLTLGGSYSGGDNHIQGIIRDNSGTGKVAVTKANDASTWILSGVNSFTGATTISGGTLLVNNPGTLASASAVAVNGSSTLGGTGTIGGTVTVAATANLAPGASAGTLAIGGGLNITNLANNGTGKLRFELGPIATSDKITVGGTLTIGTAYLGFNDFVFSPLAGLQNGTYTLITYNTLSGTLAASGLSGTISTGTGTLQLNTVDNSLELVVSGLVSTNPYETWASGAPFDADANNDGVANGLAWLLGAATPSASATALLPKPTHEAGKLVLSFRCLKTANRGAAVLKVQYSNDLGQADLWTNHEALVPDADGPVGSVFFDTTPDADPAFVNVRAEIPASAASADGKLFGRLHSSGN